MSVETESRKQLEQESKKALQDDEGSNPPEIKLTLSESEGKANSDVAYDGDQRGIIPLA